MKMKMQATKTFEIKQRRAVLRRKFIDMSTYIKTNKQQQQKAREISNK
jgi:hypothetical protein